MHMSNVTKRAAPRADTQQRFITGVYAWMTAALAVTGGAALFAVSSAGFMRLLSGSMLPLGLCVAEIALVWYLSTNIRTLSAARATAVFFIYAALNGLTLSVIFLVYTASSIGAVFFYAAAMFGGMSAYGVLTKTDLTKTGNILGMALWGVIIASVANLLLRSSGLSWLVSLATVVIFTGLTAYDAQKLTRVSAVGDSETYTKQSIFGALRLYLDFINLFLALVRLFGKRR
jgi:FtsH-binding integral membrane protein